MNSEHKIQKSIQIILSKNGFKVFRSNVGKVKTIDGRYFDTGLPKGHPDLYGFRPDGKIFYIEVKNDCGSLRDDQRRFHQMLLKNNIIHGVARSDSEGLDIVERGLIGYGY